MQRDIGVSLLQWQELPLASGLALGIVSHGILCTSGWKKKVESRQLSTLLLLLWGSGHSAHEEGESFYPWAAVLESFGSQNLILTWGLVLSFLWFQIKAFNANGQTPQTV